ncbi:hypothetical protein EBZ39_02355 [bacterium]|nr:hypothetical protein [bacterium]
MSSYLTVPSANTKRERRLTGTSRERRLTGNLTSSGTDILAPRDSIISNNGVIDVPTTYTDSDTASLLTDTNFGVDFNFVQDIDMFLKYTIMNLCWYELSTASGKTNVVDKFNKYTKNFETDRESNTDCQYVNKKIINNVYNNSREEVSLSIVTDYIIPFFIKHSLLTQTHSEYMLLNTGNPLMWDYIKALDVQDASKFAKKHPMKFATLLGMFSENTQLLTTFMQSRDHTTSQLLNDEFIQIVKCMFWYLRKVIVDTIISVCVTDFNKNINSDEARKSTAQDILRVDAVSVGSNKLESDYDITLYGNYKNISKVIRDFDSILPIIFGSKVTSDALFDTNVYGLSFIKLAKTTLVSPTENEVIYSQVVKCNNKEFMYTRVSDSDVSAQHTFAFIKVFQSIRFVQGYSDKLSFLLIQTLQSKLNGKNILEAAMTTNNFLARYSDYKSLLDNFTAFFKKYSDYPKLLVFNTYVSMVNYYGSETYFTRGAFLDVVVNQQTCKGDTLKLTEADYIDSFIENMADLMRSFHKEKYIGRAKLALDKLPDGYPKRDVHKLLDKCQKIQAGCSKEILMCSQFMLIHNCILVITEIFNYYTATVRNTDIDLRIFDDIRKRERTL